MAFKALVLVLFVAIVASLFAGLWFLVRDADDRQRVVNALAWRVGLSVLLIALLIAGYMNGLIGG